MKGKYKKGKPRKEHKTEQHRTEEVKEKKEHNSAVRAEQNRTEKKEKKRTNNFHKVDFFFNFPLSNLLKENNFYALKRDFLSTIPIYSVIT
jgi:hypothetical protein